MTRPVVRRLAKFAGAAFVAAVVAFSAGLVPSAQAAACGQTGNCSFSPDAPRDHDAPAALVALYSVAGENLADIEDAPPTLTAVPAIFAGFVANLGKAADAASYRPAKRSSLNKTGPPRA